MDRELNELLEAAKDVKMTEDEIIEQRIAVAAANGHITDSRITVETVRATKTLMEAEKAK